MTASKRDIAAMAFALTFPTLLTFAYFVWLAGTPVQNIVYAIGKSLQFAFPAVWVGLVLRKKLRWPPPTSRGLVWGLGFGLLVMAAMLAIYHLILKPSGALNGPDQAIREKVQQLKLNNAMFFLGLSIFYSLVHSLMEEYYWRWFVYGQLRRSLALTTAILISSLGFMAHHVVLLAEYFTWSSPLTYLFSLAIAVGGAYWAWLYERSQSIYGPWFGHMLVDAAIFLIGFDLVRDLFQ